MVAGRLIKAGTPLSAKPIAFWNFNTGQQFSGSPATTDGNGNYSFTGVPINSPGSDQWFVKWFTSDIVVPAGGPTPDGSEFALVQTNPFAVNSSTTYTVPDVDTGTQSLTLMSPPAENAVVTLASAPVFTWGATTMSNNGYGWRIDSATDFTSNLCSIPASGFTVGMTTTGPISSSNCSSLTASGTTRFWRVAIEETTASGITVVASTKYWRVTLN